MCIADDSETRAEAPITEDLSRFRGLTPKQIRTRIEIDTRAMAVNRFINELVVDTIEIAYKRAGFRFDHDTILDYARRAEARENNSCAQIWYDAYARRYDNTSPLRKFLVARGWLERAEERFGHLTPEEYRAIGDVAMADGDVPLAISAYRKCDHRVGITAILRKELRCMNRDAAEQAARALGRELTSAERLALIYQRGRFSTFDEDALETVRRCGRHEHKRKFISLAVTKRNIGIRHVRRWAKRLGVRISDSDLIARYKRIMTEGGLSGDLAEAAEIAEDLRKRSRAKPLWEKKLQQLYTRIRSVALNYHNPVTAERYGRKCDQPLTITELLNLADHFNSEGNRELDWAIKGRKFCLDLAVKRIAKKVGAKTKKKATKA